jgi:uncharacterized glyoxalase superfamily protein PhnB
MKVTGLVLWTQDNTLSVKFYKKLGFEMIESNDNVSVVELSGFQVMLVSMRDEPEFNRDALAGDKGRGMYLYLRVEDADAFHASLSEKGITPYTSPRDWPWGNREFIVKDPDGYKLCFWQPLN